MPKKNILVICEFLSGKGGTETVLRDFAQKFGNNHDYSISILLVGYNTNDFLWLNGLNFEIMPSFEDSVKKYRRSNLWARTFLRGGLKKLAANIIKIRKIRQYIATHDFNIVLSTTAQFIPILRKIKRNSQKSFSIFYWDHMAASFYKKNHKKFVDQVLQADGFLAISSGIKNSLLEMGAAQEKVHLIYNPIHRKQKTIHPKKNNIKFIYMGRLMCYGQKRCSDLIEAASLIKDKNFSVDIYGDGDDREVLENQVSLYKLTDKINFLGWIQQPWDKVEYADALLLVSSYEGLPMVIGESLSYGIPVISSNCDCGPADMIQPHVNGYLYPVSDIKELSKLMLNIIEQKENFEPENIKNSIEYLYIDNYINRLDVIFNACLSEN